MLRSLVRLDWLPATEEVIRLCGWMRPHRLLQLLLLLWHVTSGVGVSDVVLDLPLNLIWVLASEGDLLDLPLLYSLIVLLYIHESTNLGWLTLLAYFDFLLLLLDLELTSILVAHIGNILHWVRILSHSIVLFLVSVLLHIVILLHLRSLESPCFNHIISTFYELVLEMT